jgi:hypothetical protein
MAAGIDKILTSILATHGWQLSLSRGGTATDAAVGGTSIVRSSTIGRCDDGGDDDDENGGSGGGGWRGRVKRGRPKQ